MAFCSTLLKLRHFLRLRRFWLFFYFHASYQIASKLTTTFPFSHWTIARASSHQQILICKIGNLTPATPPTITIAIICSETVEKGSKLMEQYAEGFWNAYWIIAHSSSVGHSFICKGGFHGSREVRASVNSLESQGDFIAAGVDSQLFLRTDKLTIQFF